MKEKIIIFTVAISILFPCVTVSTPIDNNSMTLQFKENGIFQKKLDSIINKYNLLGLQISVRTSENVRWSGSSGHIDMNKKALLRNDNVLRTGSITKTFIATTILKLVEQNRLNIDDTIDNWFPEITNSELITVKMLLNQTSGIENYWTSATAVMKTLLGKNWEPAELIKIISKLKAKAEPNQIFYYSNSNYVLLAFIIEKITKKQVHEAIKNHILSECKLQNTYFLGQVKVPEKLIAGFDKEYIPWIGYYKLKPQNTTWSSFAYGAGAMASNTSDLVTFIDSLFYGSIISQKTLDEMQKYNSNVQTTNEAIPGQISYGLGLARFEIGDDILWGHMGGIMGFESIVLHCKEKNYSISIIGNLSICEVTKIVKEFQGLI